MSEPAPTSRHRDAGFSLVEVIVAVGILLLLAVSTLPQLLVGIRSNDVARQSLQEKGFAQTEVERMRNLPFHVAPAAGDYIDVLDRFFPTLTAPNTIPDCADTGPFSAPPSAWTGYVAPGAKHCPWEPSGAFYRTVLTEAGNPRLRGFVLVLDTQFLDESTPPLAVTPPADYDALQVGRDAPPTSQIGVTVSVFRTTRDVTRPMTTYAQIGRRDQLEALVASSIDVTALDLGSTTPDGLPITLAGGRIGLDASLTYASRATAVLSSTTTGISTGQQAGGAGVALSAPPEATAVAQTLGANSLDTSGCSLACWGGTRTSPVGVTSVGGLPAVGSPTSPVQASVRDMTNRGITLGGGAGAQYRSDRALTGPLVRLDNGSGIDGEGGSGTRTGVAGTCAATSGGDPVRVVSSGWLRTTSPADPVTPSVVEACGITRSATISLLPTTFAPDGVVRVNLPSAAVRCRVSGATHSATTTVSYEATVQRWSPTGYVTIATITQATTADPLAAFDLTTPLGGGNGKVGDYIESWSSATVSRVHRVAADGEASVDVPGVVTILSTPTRELAGGAIDPLSAVSMSLGVLSCSAEDRR